MAPLHNSILLASQTMAVNDYLEDQSGSFVLIMQGDGNLVLYPHGTVAADDALWSTASDGPSGSYYLIMQDDGNLVIYRGQPGNPQGAVWSSGSEQGEKVSCFLAVQEDQNVVVYLGEPGNEQGPIWAITVEAELLKNLQWSATTGTSTAGGDQGYGFVVWKDTKLNPWDHPPIYAGELEEDQVAGGGWYLRIVRGYATGTECVQAALAELHAGHRDSAIAWLCASQSENDHPQKLFKSFPGVTLKLLLERFSHLG